MAQLTLKRSNQSAKVPASGDLTWGELALNYTDGALYFKRNPDGNIYNILNLPPKVITATTATTDIDFAVANNFHITLETNTTLNIQNAALKIGGSGNIILKQDATGGRTFTKAAAMKTPVGGATIDQWTSANSVSVLSYYIVDVNTIIVNYIGNFA